MSFGQILQFTHAHAHRHRSTAPCVCVCLYVCVNVCETQVDSRLSPHRITTHIRLIMLMNSCRVAGARKLINHYIKSDAVRVWFTNAHQPHKHTTLYVCVYTTGQQPLALTLYYASNLHNTQAFQLKSLQMPFKQRKNTVTAAPNGISNILVTLL